ncbi:predicted protein [Plenodomus lingam JN3]|uniref:Predicted protein n=1 Tax=Leptosphaeria maculans (strain JN3 / isolate v23.1.3 / race Av1-4-5-6-7-8) TaxID=985895 RepID=E4ZJJ7_LEPMJ|nr:predicted protein [Plenodomus lingam JN3]CBX91282.1 predicted protein [Plenodomus lingam JN3]
MNRGSGNASEETIKHQGERRKGLGGHKSVAEPSRWARGKTRE